LTLVIKNYYDLLHISRAVACMGVRRDVYRVLVGKPDGIKPLKRPKHRWK
jgi:hypothetical protein